MPEKGGAMLVETAIGRCRSDPRTQPTLTCSVGVMAHNEEANIGRLLQALLDQQTSNCVIEEIVVVASGCTDSTESIVREFGARDPRIQLLVQPRREGKASAVNLFLRHAQSDILVLEGADTVPDPTTIQRLVEPLTDPEVGMTGGHPIPINDPRTLMGFVVHLLWELHHQVALQRPKLGELTAFRRVFHRIPYDSAVDEASIESLICGQGYQLRYVPEAIVYNRGAEAVGDFLKQRRRIYAGHLKLRHEQGYAVSTMSGIRILAALLRNWRWDWRYSLRTAVVIGLEMYGRFLGWSDLCFKKRDHTIWDIATTTKKGVVIDRSTAENLSLHPPPLLRTVQDAAHQPSTDSLTILQPTLPHLQHLDEA
jgi:biofilm PGA synthesis N-glycosyltransferase PgaC